MLHLEVHIPLELAREPMARQELMHKLELELTQRALEPEANP
jgi:hypothetical protein